MPLQSVVVSTHPHDRALFDVVAQGRAESVASARGDHARILSIISRLVPVPDHGKKAAILVPELVRRFGVEVHLQKIREISVRAVRLILPSSSSADGVRAVELGDRALRGGGAGGKEGEEDGGGAEHAAAAWEGEERGLL